MRKSPPTLPSMARAFAIWEKAPTWTYRRVAEGTGTLVTCPVGWVSANICAGIGAGVGRLATLAGGATLAPGTAPRAALSTLPLGLAGKALAISGGVSEGGGLPSPR